MLRCALRRFDPDCPIIRSGHQFDLPNGTTVRTCPPALGNENMVSSLKTSLRFFYVQDSASQAELRVYYHAAA